jgi:hypothetical protein
MASKMGELAIMSKIKKALLAAVACCTILISQASLHAANGDPEVVVHNGGYEFYTSYKIHLPSSSSLKPHNLVVETKTGRYTEVAHDYFSPIARGRFNARLNFSLDGVQKTIEVVCFGKKKHMTDKSISSSSPWYPVIKQILNKITTQYHARSDKNRAKSSQKSKTAPCLRALPNSKLTSSYSLNIKNYSANSNLSPSVFVNATTALENYKGKDRLIVTTTFCTKKFAKLTDPHSKIKFLITKEGMREIESENIEPTSLWYEPVKKAAVKSAKKFVKLRAIHESIPSKKQRKR